MPSSKGLGSAGRKRLAALLAKAGPQLALKKRGKIGAYKSYTVRFPSKALKAGYFVYGVRLAAAMNPGRTSLFVSQPFRVGPAVHAKPKHKKK